MKFYWIDYLAYAKGVVPVASPNKIALTLVLKLPYHPMMHSVERLHIRLQNGLSSDLGSIRRKSKQSAKKQCFGYALEMFWSLLRVC